MLQPRALRTLTGRSQCLDYPTASLPRLRASVRLRVPRRSRPQVLLIEQMDAEVARRVLLLGVVQRAGAVVAADARLPHAVLLAPAHVRVKAVLRELLAERGQRVDQPLRRWRGRLLGAG